MRALIVAVVCGAVMWSAAPVRAADELMIMGPSSSDLQLVDLSGTPIGDKIAGVGSMFAWMPDGTQILARTNNGVEAMDPDGANRRVVSAKTSAGNFASAPAVSPDGQRFAIIRVRAGDNVPELMIGKMDGSSLVPLTLPVVPRYSGYAISVAWSVHDDLAFVQQDNENDDTNSVHLIHVDGTNHRKVVEFPPPAPQTQTSNTHDEVLGFAFSPDGNTLALGRYIGFGFPAGGGDPTHEWRITTLAVGPGGLATDRKVGENTGSNVGIVDGVFPHEVSFAPDGERTAVVGHPDNGSPPGDQVQIYRPAGGTMEPLPFRSLIRAAWRPNGCSGQVTVGLVQARGCFKPGDVPGTVETTQTAYVGGFEIRPRFGGTLVLNTVTPAVTQAGAGVDVIMAAEPMEIPVEQLPVTQQEATIEIGQVGTVPRAIWSKFPVQASLKVTWEPGGSSAALEGKADLDRLGGPIGQVVGKAGGAFKARVVNGEGLVFDSFEARIDELSIIPANQTGRFPLKLKSLLVKYEVSNGVALLTGQGGIEVPNGKGSLDLIGRVIFADGTPAGGGVTLDGIDKQIGGTPIHLQKVSGDLAFRPSFGYGLAIGGSFGPKINNKILFGFEGSAQGGPLATGCPDTGGVPSRFTIDTKLRPFEPLTDAGFAKVDIKGTLCVLVQSPIPDAVDAKFTAKVEFPPIDTAYEAEERGLITGNGVSLDGAATIRIALLPDINGRAIISNTGGSACGSIGFALAGVAWRWGQTPTAFSGCDIGRFRPAPRAGGSAAAAGAAVTVKVPRGLPFAGLRIPGKGAAPRVRVTGPRGVRITSPAGTGARRSPRFVVVPLPSADATYVFVRRPRAGRYVVRALGGARLGKVALAPGLPKPKVKGKLKRVGKKLRLAFKIRRIPGQKVVFVVNADGAQRRIGAPRKARGILTFAHGLKAGTAAAVEAQVLQHGLLRTTLRVARFTAR